MDAKSYKLGIRYAIRPGRRSLSPAGRAVFAGVMWADFPGGPGMGIHVPGLQRAPGSLNPTGLLRRDLTQPACFQGRQILPCLPLRPAAAAAPAAFFPIPYPGGLHQFERCDPVVAAAAFRSPADRFGAQRSSMVWGLPGAGGDQWGAASLAAGRYQYHAGDYDPVFHPEHFRHHRYRLQPADLFHTPAAGGEK